MEFRKFTVDGSIFPDEFEDEVDELKEKFHHAEACRDQLQQELNTAVRRYSQLALRRSREIWDDWPTLYPKSNAKTQNNGGQLLEQASAYVVEDERSGRKSAFTRSSKKHLDYSLKSYHLN